MAKGAYYFPLYYQRLLASCTGWKDDEFGAYLKLLIYQFDRGSIPENLDELARICSSVKKTWPMISKKFVPGPDPGTLINSVMDEIRQEALQKSQKNAANGSKGGKAKTKRSVENGLSENEANAKRTQSNTNMVNGYSVNGFRKEGGAGEEKQPIVQVMWDTWQALKPDYPPDQHTDYQALFSIGEFLSGQIGIRWPPETDDSYTQVREAWIRLAGWISHDSFYKNISLHSISKTSTLQTIYQKHNDNGTAQAGTSAAGKPGTSQARIDALKTWGSDFRS
jgi:uncharacterized protein YdaU (DUF1376 family)